MASRHTSQTSSMRNCLRIVLYDCTSYASIQWNNTEESFRLTISFCRQNFPVSFLVHYNSGSVNMKALSGLFVFLSCTCFPNSFFVRAQPTGCTSAGECITNNAESCQVWIDRSYNFQGDCCSFQDLPDGGCLLVTVGYCSYQNGPDCDPNSDGCAGSKVVLKVDDPTAECPNSNYTVTLDTIAPTSPVTSAPTPVAAPMTTEEDTAPTPASASSAAIYFGYAPFIGIVALSLL